MRSATVAMALVATLLATGCEGPEPPALDANEVMRVARAECAGPGQEYCLVGFGYGAADAEALASGATDMSESEAYTSGLAAAEAELLAVFDVGARGKARMREAYREGWDWYLAQT